MKKMRLGKCRVNAKELEVPPGCVCPRLLLQQQLAENNGRRKGSGAAVVEAKVPPPPSVLHDGAACTVPVPLPNSA